MANVKQVVIEQDKHGNAKEIVRYENNLGACPSPDTRYIGVTSEQVMSITNTAYCKVKTASYNSYYNHEDIRAVHLDKAPWNDWFFFMTCLSFIIMLYGFTDGFADEEKTSKEGYELSDAMLYLGLIGLVLFLIYLIRLVYQYMRPKVYATIDTARWGASMCGWSNLSEGLVWIGKGPGVDVKSKDDIGVGILSKMEDEQVLQEHNGRKIKGEFARIVITDKRFNVRRSKRCCCNLILREDRLSSYKLEEIQNTTADSSFPLWWVLATIYAVGLIIGYLVECSDDNKPPATRTVNGNEVPHICYDKTKAGEEWEIMMAILAVVGLLFFRFAAGMAGGIGYCRRSYVTIYFAGPNYIPCMFMGKSEELELPKGSAQDKADTIAKSIMGAKDRKKRQSIRNA
jgi:hypothetical protein